MDITTLEQYAMRELLGGGAAPAGIAGPDGTVCVDPHKCFCVEWGKSHGSDMEKKAVLGCQWFAFVVSVLILVYYAYHAWKSTCGWEEVYVCCIELIKVCLEIFHEFDSPATLYLSTGNQVLWLRYGEWLLTCPVILIHLSNITGLKNDYNKRTMRLLISDVGTIVLGTTAAMAQGYIKLLFFLLGCCYGANTFFTAAKIYIESYHSVPKGECRMLVRIMAWLFYASWAMFPILFVIGPEGFGHITAYGSTVGHTVIDLMSKNFWGLTGHRLREKIHEHIIIHGDLRKTVKMNIAGEDVEVEQYVEAEEVDEETVKHSTKELANRESFLVIRDRLKAQGYDVRASLEGSAGEAATAAAPGMKPPAVGGALIEPGRVILAVPDISMVDYFRQEFAQLPAAIELVPALGADNCLALVQQAMGLGGCDFILVHPEFLRDRSPNGLVARLRAMGQRVCAFGWAAAGPQRELVEGAGLDGWLEGPSFGSGINREQLIALIQRAQTLKKEAMMRMMSMSMMGGMGGMGMMGGMSGVGVMGAGVNPMGGLPALQKASMGGSTSQLATAMSMNPPMSPSHVQLQSMGSQRFGTNPLYNAVPSPLHSNPGILATTSTPQVAAPAAAPASGNAASEAEMLQQLMNEITRLKSELGEQP